MRVHHIVIAVFMLLAGGCSTKIGHVDFKYSSDSHIPPKERFLVLNQSPDRIAEKIRAFVGDSKGRVLESMTEGNAAFSLAPQSAGAYEAHRTLYEAEWKAFQANDIRLYRKIPRTDPRLVQQEVLLSTAPVTGGQYLKAEFEPRKGHMERQYVAGLWNFTVRTHHDITSVLYVWVWQDAAKKTHVYARAVPRIKSVEAAPGAWTQYSMWDATTGAFEAEIIKKLFDALRG